MRFWIRLFFFTRLRLIVNAVQRTFAMEWRKPRADLPTFETPAELEAYVRERFKWGEDGVRIGGLFIPLDYVKNPRVTQALLEKAGGLDGDCDDVHFWVATVLETVPGVAWAHPLSCVWKGGGHVTCVYSYKGFEYLFNYGIQGPIELDDAPALVLKWKNQKLTRAGEPQLPKLWFWVRETIQHKLIAVGG
jgi:hypothetical protein